MIDFPDTLPEMVIAAVGDAQKIEKDDRYELDMTFWHQAKGDPIYYAMIDGRIQKVTTTKRCHVCFAGTVIACRSNTPHFSSTSPTSFDPTFKKKLYAIDAFRTGQVWSAYSLIGSDIPKNAEAVTCFILEHYDDVLRRAPWEIYLEAAQHLRDGTYPKTAWNELRSEVSYDIP